MPGREHFINMIRKVGFGYKDQAKRVSIWKRGTDRIMLPKRKVLSDEWCRVTLRQNGVSEEEIEEFLRSANS